MPLGCPKPLLVSGHCSGINLPFDRHIQASAHNPQHKSCLADRAVHKVSKAGSHDPGVGIDDSCMQECHVWSEVSSTLPCLEERQSDIVRR